MEEPSPCRLTTRASRSQRVSGAGLLTTLGIFGKLRDRSLDVLSLIGRELMKDSPFYYDLLEEGEQTGQHKAILQVLQLRFGDEAVEEFTPALNDLTNLEQ